MRKKPNRVSKYLLLKKAIKIMRRNEGTFSCYQLWVCDAFSERNLGGLRKAISDYNKNNERSKVTLQNSGRWQRITPNLTAEQISELTMDYINKENELVLKEICSTFGVPYQLFEGKNS